MEYRTRNNTKEMQYLMRSTHAHINSLDFIKICATFAIIFHHYQQFLQVRFSHMNFFDGAFSFHSMVWLFFTLSGFFMAGYIPGIMRKEIAFEPFVKKRAFRLLPLTALSAVVYEAALILFIFLTGTTFQDYTNRMGLSGIGVLNGIGMLFTMAGTGSGWFWKGNMANEVAWYICVLLLCYLVFFIGCRMFGRFKMHVDYFFIIMMMVGVSCASYSIQLPFLNGNSLQGYVPFFVGVMLGEFMERREYTAKGTVFGLAVAGLLGSMIYVVGMFAMTRQTFTDSYWLMFITFPCLIVVFLSEPVKRLFASRIWRIWGGVLHLICMCGTLYV